jgi:hypothetical protein
MGGDGNPSDKKDLTGILELPQLDPVSTDGAPVAEDPFAVNELKPIEAIDSFESIDEIGMMDHEPPPEADPAPPPEPNPFGGEPLSEDPFAALAPPEPEPVLDAAPPMDFFSEPSPEPVPEAAPEPASPPPLPEPAAPAPQPLAPIRAYAEKVKEAVFSPGVRNPHHLVVSGDFDLFARDKLLLFITENDVGISSSELDFQISGGRVLFSRISEFSGIRLIQDLRDSGLQFLLKPSPMDPDDLIPESPSVRVHYERSEAEEKREGRIPVLPPEGIHERGLQVFDTIRMVQYLRAEMLEVEKSELFQDLVERMTEALKRRAVLKGAEALGSLEHRITPLRLPSQYEVEMKASLLKKS